MSVIKTTGEKKSLVIGCGRRPKSGATNLDMVQMPGVDIVCEVGKERMPFANESFDYIEAEDILEHVDDIVKVMVDIWRVLKPGGEVWIRGPHASYPLQAWRDPTHKRLFVPGSFDMWDTSTNDGKQYGHYVGGARFKVLKQIEKNMGMEYWLLKI